MRKAIWIYRLLLMPDRHNARCTLTIRRRSGKRHLSLDTTNHQLCASRFDHRTIYKMLLAEFFFKMDQSESTTKASFGATRTGPKRKFGPLSAFTFSSLSSKNALASRPRSAQFYGFQPRAFRIDQPLIMRLPETSTTEILPCWLCAGTHWTAAVFWVA